MRAATQPLRPLIRAATAPSASMMTLARISPQIRPHAHVADQRRYNHDKATWELIRRVYTDRGNSFGHAPRLAESLYDQQCQEETAALTLTQHTLPSENGNITLYLLGYQPAIPPEALIQTLENEGTEKWLRFSVYPQKRVIAIADGHQAEHYDIWQRLQKEAGLEHMHILTSIRGYFYPEEHVRYSKTVAEAQNLSLEEYYPQPRTDMRVEDIKPHLQLMHDAGFRKADFTLFPQRGRHDRCKNTTFAALCEEHGIGSWEKAEENEQTWADKISATPVAPGVHEASPRR